MPVATCSIISGKNCFATKKAAKAATAKIPSQVSQLVEPEPLIDIKFVFECYRVVSFFSWDEVRKTLLLTQKA